MNRLSLIYNQFFIFSLDSIDMEVKIIMINRSKNIVRIEFGKGTQLDAKLDEFASKNSTIQSILGELELPENKLFGDMENIFFIENNFLIRTGHKMSTAIGELLIISTFETSFYYINLSHFNKNGVCDYKHFNIIR